jgi:uncharacterized protein (TIGR02118 family)
MAETKIIVIYPRPKDVEAFEKVYTEEHLPMAKEKIEGVTRIVTTKVLGTPDGSEPPFYRIAELYFPSMEALEKSAASPGTQSATVHALSISTGGKPIFLVAEEETITI